LEIRAKVANGFGFNFTITEEGELCMVTPTFFEALEQAEEFPFLEDINT
jgi:hypothetical protein